MAQINLRNIDYGNLLKTDVPEQVIEDALSSCSFIDYLMLFEKSQGLQKWERILSFDSYEEEAEKLVKFNTKFRNSVFSPMIPNGHEELLTPEKRINLLDFQKKGNFQKSTICIFKNTSLETVKEEISLLEEQGREITFLLDPVYLLRSYEVISYLNSIGTNLIRVRVRGIRKTKRILEFIRDNTSMHVHICGLSSTYSSKDQILPLEFMYYSDIIESYSQGVRSPPFDSEGFLLKSVDEQNGKVVIIGKTTNKKEFYENTLELISSLNSLISKLTNLDDIERKAWFSSRVQYTTFDFS